MPVSILTGGAPAIPRRSAMLLPWLATALLAACVDETPPPDFLPLDFNYLTKLRLLVATIDVDTSWTPTAVPNAQHVEALSPIQPLESLRRMAQERLIPAGSDGHAVFVVDDASLLRTGRLFEGNLKVHLDLNVAEGTRTGYAEAQVTRTRTISDDSVVGTQVALYELVKQMMADMNVEFEFQVRRSLREYLQGSPETAPPPTPVQQQDLNGGPDSPPPPPPPAQSMPDTQPPPPMPVSPPQPPPPQ